MDEEKIKNLDIGNEVDKERNGSKEGKNSTSRRISNFSLLSYMWERITNNRFKILFSLWK